MMTAELWITITLTFLTIVYVWKIAGFHRGLSLVRKGTNTVPHTLTVIVPARNEEVNIAALLRCLIAQDYPAGKFSVIVVDDQSTDRTAEIVRAIAQDSPVPITQLESDLSSSVRSPKIRALIQGIQHSLSEIIVTTDADCTMGTRWLASVNAAFEEHVGVVTGVTSYSDDASIGPVFRGIQYLDFISYTAIAAGAVGLGRVLVSNGSNMAFRIQAFDETGGFDALTHINTGDDSLLAQQLTAGGKWRAQFLFGPDATVLTQPVRTWKAMLHQRMRWVGQTAYYPADMMFFMICTFILYVALGVLVPAALFFSLSIVWFVLLAKFGMDFLIMSRFTKLSGTSDVMRYFLPTAIIHIPFVLLATVGGYFFTFEWKERSMKKEAA